MPRFTRPGRRVDQPQQAAAVDRRNPLAAGLVAAITSVGGRLVDVLSNTYPVPFGTAPVPTSTPRGRGSLATAGGWTFVGDQYAQAGAYTHFGLMNLSAIVNAYGGIYGGGRTDGNEQSQFVQRDGGSNNLSFYQSGSDNPAVTSGSETLLLTDGNFHTLVLSGDGTAGGRAIYIDGNSIAFSGGNMPPANSSPGRLVLYGERGASAGTGSSGAYLVHFVWNRQLTQSEIRALNLNPWQLFAPVQRKMLLPAPAAGGVTLTPAASSVAITGYAPTLAQTANQGVTPGAASLAITGYAPTLAQPRALQPAAASVAITGYAPTIAQPHGLTPAAAAISLVGYAPSLVQTANQSVSPAPAALTITGYAPTITQGLGVNLVPSPATLAITGYAPTLAQTQAQTVSPAPAALTITGYAPTITQGAGVTFVPAPAALVIQGYAPTLAQPRGLAPAAGAVALQGYAPTLAQPHGLTPAPAALTIQGYAPTLVQTQARVLQPLAAVTTITGYAPTLTVAGPYVWEYSERVLRMLPDNRVVRKLPEKRIVYPVPNHVRF